jgi:hypothetical protein
MRKPLTVLACFFIAFTLGDAFLLVVVLPCLIGMHLVIGAIRGVWHISRALLSGPPRPSAARQTGPT